MPKYLTKSRFAVALHCPTKLYYLDKSKEYANQKNENEFLEALAEGGFQVGELAKYYFPGGVDIRSLNYEEALSETNELLKQENAIIYEAAVQFEDFFIRIDILKKHGNTLELIEVKAKSFNPEEDTFTNKKGFIQSGWLPYLQDVAFQTWVTESAFPDCTLVPYLMLADKSSKTSVDGLNQIFKVVPKDEKRKEVKIMVPEITPEILGNKILVQIPVREYIDQIVRGDEKDPGKKNLEESKSLIKRAKLYAQYYAKGDKYPVSIGSKCKDCEFQCNEEAIAKGKKDGFIECWNEATQGRYDPGKQHIFNIWNYRKKDKLIDEGKYHIDDVTQDDISLKQDNKSGLSGSQRQWMQVEKYQHRDNTPFIDKEGLADERSKWIFPLHFIDFETSAVAIPFSKGRRPYEGIAFQWSHHIIDSNGTIEHKGQYLNTKPGVFPNFDFVRSLKKELENDAGTIFRYAAHENTFLNIIHEQLLDSGDGEIPDKNELIDFIESITHSSGSASEEWCGDRDMVDMWELVKRYLYFPDTNGSNSIKAVLPAVLQYSTFLQDKYSKPLYGAENGIKSHNYRDWIWIRFDNNKYVSDPYKLLPPLFEGINNEELDNLDTDQTLADGGAALTAYGKLQFSDISDIERRKINEGLLRYCELDTMAMVMIWEFIEHEIEGNVVEKVIKEKMLE